MDFRLRGDENGLRLRNRAYVLPFIVYVGIVIATPFTGWLFYVDGSNIYQRGPLYFIQIALSLLYLFVPTVMAIWKAHKLKMPLERNECYNLAGFALFPLLGAIIQVLFYGLPAITIAIVFAELLIFVNVQNRQISTDALTQINNRGQLNRYLYVTTKDEQKNQNLYMLLMDIDKFKQINDTYGRKQGDQALIDMADILKRVCSIYRGFLARYGGDEFAVILECQSTGEVQAFIGSMERELEEFNQKAGREYQIAISIGYAHYGTEATKTVEQLIEVADHEMYRQKLNNTVRI